MKKTVVALSVIGLLIALAPGSAVAACSKDQMLIKIRGSDVIGGSTCADFGGTFWGNVFYFWF